VPGVPVKWGVSPLGAGGLFNAGLVFSGEYRSGVDAFDDVADGAGFGAGVEEFLTNPCPGTQCVFV
jgi:hypothetical protein